MSDRLASQLSTTSHEIKTLILSFHPLVVIETVEEDRVELILDSVASQLGIPLFEWSLTKGLRRRGERIPFHATDQPLILLKHLAGLTVEGIFLLKDFSQHLSSPEVSRQFKELGESFSQKRSTLVLTGGSVDLPSDILHLAVHYDLKLPGEGELRGMLRELFRSLRKQKPYTLDLGPDDLEHLVSALRGLTLKQARRMVAYCVWEDARLDSDDIEKILARKGKAIREQGLLEYYPAEANNYELGGFGSLRAWLARAKVGFSKEARGLNLDPPKGILLVGVQGCGKSLAAKHVARDWGLPLLRLEMSRMYDKFIGESEKNFRRAIQQAESMAPVVLWIDEIEKGLSAPKSSEADGGLSARLMGTFLTWLQEKNSDVFVVSTANNVSALPAELLRKGRFDEVFFVDLPNHEERKAILRIHLQLRQQDPGRFDLDRLAERLDGYSGAEIEQLIVSALYQSLHGKTALTTETIETEGSSTIPLSVSRREEVSALREWARDRFVNVR